MQSNVKFFIVLSTVFLTTFIICSIVLLLSSEKTKTTQVNELKQVLISSDKTKTIQISELDQVIKLANGKNVFKNYKYVINENVLTKENALSYYIILLIFWKENQKNLLTPQTIPSCKLVQELFVKTVLDDDYDLENFQKKLLNIIANYKGKTIEDKFESFLIEIYNTFEQSAPGINIHSFSKNLKCYYYDLQEKIYSLMSEITI